MNILNSKFVVSAAVLLITLSFSEPAAAFRCGSKLVKAGMSTDDVRGYCGAPNNESEEERPIRSGSRVLGSFVAQIWEYSRGGNSPAVLEFHDGVLKTITYPDKR